MFTPIFRYDIIRKKARSKFLYLRRRAPSKRLPWGKFHLRFKWEDRRKDLCLFDLIIPLRRTSVACSGRILSGGTLTSKLVLEVQTPAPCTYYVSAEFRLPVTCSRSINFGCRTRELLAKGSSSILASRRILYQGFTSLDSGIHSLNFCTITNLVKLKLEV